MHWPLVVVCLLATSADASIEALQQHGAKVTLEKGVVTQVQVNASNWGEDEYRLLGQCTTLKRLSINGKTLNDRTLPLLSGLVALEELSTNQTQLSDGGYRHFAQFPKLRALALFHPSWAQKDFTGAGLAHLKGHRNLERLTFAGSTAGDAALEAIGQLDQLKEFSTWHTAQTQAGNQHLLGLKHLTFLKLGQRLPKGKEAPPSFDRTTIALLAKMASLERLELFEARFSAADLAPLQALPNLRQLKIHTVDISPEEIEKLQATLKDVKVDFKPLSEDEREATLVKKLRL